MNCSILGVPQNTIEELILKSSHLVNSANFIDYPVRTYSAGMCLRLGFSIASHVPSDILLIDEVLTVGDQYFQRKCVQKSHLFWKKNGQLYWFLTISIPFVHCVTESFGWKMEASKK